MPVETSIVCVVFEPGAQSRFMETSICVSLVVRDIEACLDMTACGEKLEKQMTTTDLFNLDKAFSVGRHVRRSFVAGTPLQTPSFKVHILFSEAVQPSRRPQGSRPYFGRRQSFPPVLKISVSCPSRTRRSYPPACTMSGLCLNTCSYPCPHKSTAKGR